MNIRLGGLAAVLVLVLTSCLPPSGEVPETGSGPISGPVSFEVTTESYGGEYSPSHVLAMWVEKDNGTFVRTLGVWGKNRRSNLKEWSGSGGTVDGTTGATLKTHGNKAVQWDFKDSTGTLVANGGYKLWAEMAESNVSNAASAKKLSIDFNVAMGTPATGTGVATAGFAAAAFTYTP